MNNRATPPGSVTVVIPARNRWPWLADAIDSALNQSHPSTQVIVVDDASSDGSAEHVKARYGDRVHLIRNPRRAEKSRSRNAGIRAATTDFVCMLDSDDLLLPEGVAQRLKPFLDDPAFDGVSYGVGQRDRKRPTPNAARYPSGRILPQYLADFSRLDNNAILLKRSLMLESGMYRPDLTHMEDRELLLRLTARVPFRFCGAVTHRIRRVDRSARRQYVDILRQGHALTAALREDPALVRQLGAGFRAVAYMEDRELARAFFKLRRYPEYLAVARTMLQTYPEIMRTNKRVWRRMCVARTLNALRLSASGESLRVTTAHTNQGRPSRADMDTT